MFTMTQGETSNERNAHGVKNDTDGSKNMNIADDIGDIIPVTNHDNQREFSEHTEDLTGNDRDSDPTHTTESNIHETKDNSTGQFSASPDLNVTSSDDSGQIDNHTDYNGDDEACVSKETSTSCEENEEQTQEIQPKSVVSKETMDKKTDGEVLQEENLHDSVIGPKSDEAFMCQSASGEDEVFEDKQDEKQKDNAKAEHVNKLSEDKKGVETKYQSEMASRVSPHISGLKTPVICKSPTLSGIKSSKSREETPRLLDKTSERLDSSQTAVIQSPDNQKSELQTKTPECQILLNNSQIKTPKGRDSLTRSRIITPESEIKIKVDGNNHDKALLNSKQIFKPDELTIKPENNEQCEAFLVRTESRQTNVIPSPNELKPSSEQPESTENVACHDMGKDSGHISQDSSTENGKETSVGKQENEPLLNDTNKEHPNVNEGVASKDDGVANSAIYVNKIKGNFKLQTLADLICVCRSKGLQVYNNVENRPESDKMLYSDADLKATDDRGSRMSKRHRSDERSSRRKSQSTHRSKSVKSQRDDMFSDTTSGYHVARGRLNTGTSSMSIPSNKIREPFDRTTLYSRLSGRSGIDRKYVETDVDSEELLQQRMWRRSKRRRDKIISLSDVVRERQKQIDAAAIISRLHASVSKMAEGINGDDVNSKPSALSDGLENDKKNDQTSDKSSDKTTSNEINKHSPDGSDDNLNNKTNDGNEIKEYKIKDGNTTLVLYNLKADKIQDEAVREKVLQESMSSQGGKMTDEKASLINNSGCQISESGDNSNDSNTNHVHSDSPENIVPQPEQDQLKTKDHKDNSNKESSEDEEDNDMETRRRKYDSKTVKGTDSGIGSESERDSIKRNDLDTVKHVPKASVANKSNRKSYGKSQMKGNNNSNNNNRTNNPKEINMKREPQRHGKEVKPVARSKAPVKERRTGPPKEDNTNKKVLKSKRSLGNGFLVSEEKEAVKNDRNEAERAQKVREMDKLYHRSKNLNDLPKQTRMTFIMAKIRERFDEEEKSQKMYLQQIQRARLELRGEYRSMKKDLGDDADGQADGRAHGTDGSQADGEETEAEVDHEPEVGGENMKKIDGERNKHTKASSSHEIRHAIKSQGERRKQSESGPSHKERPPIQSQSKIKHDEPKEIIAVESSVSKRMKGKFRIMSKIDTRWSPEHKLYPMIKSGFKSDKKIPHHKDIQRYLYNLRKQTSCRDLLNSDTVTAISARHLYLKTDKHSDNTRSDRQRNNLGLKRLKSKRKNNRYIHVDKYDESDENESQSSDNRRYAKRVHRKDRINNLESVRETNENDNKKINPYLHSRIPMPIWRLSKYSKPKKLSNAIHEQTRALHHNPKLVRHYSYNVNDDMSDSRHNHKVIDSVASANRAPDKNNHHSNPVSRRGYATSSTTSTSQSRTTSSSTELPMTLAVDIVQSRNKFYSERVDEDTPRGERIWQLYKDLQEIRQRNPNQTGSRSNHVTGSDPNFLLMSYDALTTPLWKQRTDRDFNKFLYGRFNYELCSKGRPLYMGVDRKEKALNTLKQKVHSKGFISPRVN